MSESVESSSRSVSSRVITPVPTCGCTKLQAPLGGIGRRGELGGQQTPLRFIEDGPVGEHPLGADLVHGPGQLGHHNILRDGLQERHLVGELPKGGFQIRAAGKSGPRPRGGDPQSPLAEHAFKSDGRCVG